MVHYIYPVHKAFHYSFICYDTCVPVFIPYLQVELQLDLEEVRKEIEQLKEQKQHPIAHANFCQRRASLEASIFFKSPSISLLLQWCQAVCAIYGVTVSFFMNYEGSVFR